MGKYPWKDDAEAATSLEGYWQDTGKAPIALIRYAVKKGWVKKTSPNRYEWTPSGINFLENSQ